MSSILLTAPAVEPLSLAEAKAFLRVEHGDDDDVIGALISASRIHVEAQTRRALVTQNWRITLDAWPADGRLPVRPAPLRTLAAARIYDAGGVAHAVDTESFVVDAAGSELAFAPWALAAPGRLAAGTYAGQVVLKKLTGSGSVSIVGDPSTPANVLFSPSGTVISCDGVSGYFISGIKTVATSGATTFAVTNGSVLTLNSINFGGGAGGGSAIYLANNSYVTIGSNIAVSGGYGYFLNLQNSSVFQMQSITVTITGTPAFSVWCLALMGAAAQMSGVTYSGSATGQRYDVSTNAAVNSGVTLPGSAAGSTASGGQYA